MSPSTIIIGIGNEFRGDDSAGIQVVRLLRASAVSQVEIIEHDGEGIDLIHAWDGYSRVIVIDAVVCDDPVGTVRRIRVTRDTLQLAEYRCSSHRFALPDAVKLAATLDMLPESLIVFGIAGNHFDFGSKPSSAVSEAIVETVELVLKEVSQVSTGVV